MVQTGRPLPREHPYCPHDLRDLGDRDAKHRGEQDGQRPTALGPRGGVSASGPQLPAARERCSNPPPPRDLVGTEHALLSLTGLAPRVRASPPELPPGGWMRPENASFQRAPGEAPLQTGDHTGGPGGVTVTEAEVSGAHPTPVGLGARGVLCINNSSSPHTAPRGRGRGHYYPTPRVGVGRTHMATPPDRVTQDPPRGPCFHPLFPGSSASGPVGCKTLGALRGVRGLGGEGRSLYLVLNQSRAPSGHLPESSALGRRHPKAK